MRANVKSRWWNSRAKKDFELWKRFNQQLHDAFHNNNELSSKLNDARKRAEKFRQDLKKANRKLQQMQEKIKRLQSEKDQRKPSSMKDAIP
jgi:chromosome segregation ATPase